MGEAVDSKPKQKDLREKLLRSKVMSCRADKVKRLERWKEKRDDAKSVDKEKEREMLIAKMRGEDKEEASKLMSRLKEDNERLLLNIFQDYSNNGGRKEDLKKESLLKEEDGGGRVHQEKFKNSLGGRLTEMNSCTLEEYFKRRKQGMVTQRTEDETAMQEKLKRCDASEQDAVVKKQKRDTDVENVQKIKKKHGEKRTRIHEEYLRLKEEKVTKKVRKEVLEEILSDKGWKEMPDRTVDKKTYKKFKKLFKRKVEEKLVECQSKRRRGDGAKKGDINDNVVESGGEEEELAEVEREDWNVKELSDERAVEEGLGDVTLSEEGCVKENYEEGGFNITSADGGGEAAAVTEEVVSEDESTEEEGGLDISEDLRTEEEDPGYIQWKLAYLKAKLKELEEKEVMRTSTSRDCDERVTPEMSFSREKGESTSGDCDERETSEMGVWICEESPDQSKDGQIEEGDTSEAEDKVSSLGVGKMELEEGEVVESEACVKSKEEERIFNCRLSLPSGFLEAVVKACTREVPTRSSEPTRKRVLKLVKKKVSGVKEVCKKRVLEESSSSEPDPSALEHLDLRPPQSSYPPFTMMMHQQVIAHFSS